MNHLYFKPIALTIMAFPWLLCAQTKTLTISEALDLGRARENIQAIIQGQLDFADSEIQARTTWDNPELSVSSEEIDQAGLTAREQYMVVSQKFENPGVRSLKVRAARQGKTAIEWRNQSRLMAFEKLIKQRFYETLYHQNRLGVLTQWVEEAAAISRVVAHREEEGEVSGFDRRRLNTEIAQARSQLSRDRGKHLASLEKVKALLGVDDQIELSGPLLPSPPNPKQASPNHPGILALDAEIRAAELEKRAAKRWFLPQFTLEAGLKSTKLGGEQERGIFIAAKVPIPAFNRQQPELARARAKIALAKGEKALALATHEADRRSLQTQLHQLRTSGTRYQADAIKNSRELVKIARLAYEEGEMEILTLLDALKTMRDAQLKGLEFEFEARSLTIELEALGGGH